MPGRSIYFISQIIAIRHNHQVVCHQLLYVLLIFIDGSKDEIKNLISKFFFKIKKS
jgi:hypothetical protein